MSLNLCMKIIRLSSGIILRQLHAPDAPDIFQAIDTQRTYLGRWLPFVESTRALADSEAYVRSVEEGSEPVFTIRVDGAFAGLVGFRNTDLKHLSTEIGYWLREEFQHRGIMTGAVSRLIDFAFEELGVERVTIRCAVGNERSRNIPRRLGFSFEGVERNGELLAGGVFTDLEVYGYRRYGQV